MRYSPGSKTIREPAGASRKTRLICREQAVPRFGRRIATSIMKPSFMLL